MRPVASARRGTTGVPQGAARTLALAVLLVGVLALALPAAAAATPADTAATHAYLLARYTLTRELAASEAQATAAARAAAARLAGECADVLADVPREARVVELSRPPGGAPLPPRARGEAARRLSQLSALEEELLSTLLAAAGETVRPAIATFMAAIAQLSWSNPEVAEAVHAETTLFTTLFEPSVPDVCTDMRSWVASGYRTITQASRAFRAQQQEDLIKESFKHSVEQLLKPYEGPAERALLRRTAALRNAGQTAPGGALEPLNSVRIALGLPLENEQLSPAGTVVGHGRTRSGVRFAVRVTHPKGAKNRCRLSVSVEFDGGLEGPDSGSASCISRPASRPDATVACQDGQLTIESMTLPRTRSVRLLLSNGRRVGSHVSLVPKRLGGPFGIYVQAIRGAETPVSLTELDAHGNTVRVVRLRSKLHCSKAPRLPAPSFKTIVTGTTADGTVFTIAGLNAPGPTGHPEVSLIVTAQPETPMVDSPLSETTTDQPQLFSGAQLKTGCAPHQYTIVYAQLKAPGATVLAQTANGLIALQQIPLPASLHGQGELVYGVLASVPSEVIVRAADGTTLVRESLMARATETGEFCEGFVER